MSIPPGPAPVLPCASSEKKRKRRRLYPFGPFAIAHFCFPLSPFLLFLRYFGQHLDCPKLKISDFPPAASVERKNDLLDNFHVVMGIVDSRTNRRKHEPETNDGCNCSQPGWVALLAIRLLIPLETHEVAKPVPVSFHHYAKLRSITANYA